MLVTNAKQQSRVEYGVKSDDEKPGRPSTNRLQEKESVGRLTKKVVLLEKQVREIE